MTAERKISWSEFESIGATWFANRMLRILGIELVAERDTDGHVCGMHAEQTVRRVVTESEDAQGFEKVTRYLAAEVRRLVMEAEQ